MMIGYDQEKYVPQNLPKNESEVVKGVPNRDQSSEGVSIIGVR